MPTSAPPQAPRIAALDIVRGIAVGGILLANVWVFFGNVFTEFVGPSQVPATRLDTVVEAAGHILVEGKFYSIFSLLFGIGFGVQLLRGGDAAVARFRRRVRILLAIGAVHAFFIWAGDILMLYAFLGLTMPWFARKPDATLIKWVIGLLAVPTALYLIGVGILWGVGAPAPGQGPPGTGMPPEIVARFNAIGTGGVADALIGNLIMLAGRWADLFVTMRFPKVLGMFVLGLWLVRQGIATDPAAHRARLVTWRRLGLLIGLPANVIGWWALSQWPYLPPSPGGLVGVVAQAVGYPMLALGYAATITLAVVAGVRWLEHFGYVGRMALSNYLTHSIVCVVLSYGFGFGLWMRVGAAGTWMIAAIIIAVQIPLSRWWLSGHRYGPMEWVWRRLTYREPLPMRR